MPEERTDERSLGDLVALASKDISTLVRAEVELAKAEITADAKRAGIGGALFIGAALIGHLVVIVLSVALALGLHAAGLWDWLAFLVVGVFYLLVGALMVFVGIRKMKRLTGPRRTMRTVKGNIGMLRHGDKEAADAEAATVE